MAESWVNSAERIGSDLHLELSGPGGRRAALIRALRDAVRSRAARPRHPAAALPLARRRPRRRPQHGRRRLRRTGRRGLAHRPPGLRHPRRRARPSRCRPAARPRRRPPTQRACRPAHDLRQGTPDASAFPRTAWLASARRALHQAPNEAFGPGDPAGRPELRSGPRRTTWHARVACGPSPNGSSSAPGSPTPCGCSSTRRRCAAARPTGRRVLRPRLPPRAAGRGRRPHRAAAPRRTRRTASTGCRRERARAAHARAPVPDRRSAAPRAPGGRRRLGTRAWRGWSWRTTTTGSSATTASRSAPSRASTPSA